nr:reverse transcriptase domain-containing protein [Tanacetum cinerariifolium]
MSTRSSARNLFPPLDNPELTIRRRSRADPTLLNDFEMPSERNGDLPVPDLWTMEELCQPSLNGRGGPIAPIAIQATNFGLKNDMIQQVQNSCQFHGLLGDDANKHLDKFLHVTQSIKVNGVTDEALRLYLFPHSLTHHATVWFDRLPRNSINTFEQMDKMFLGGTFMKRCPKECYDLIENMTAHHNDWDTSAQRSESSSSITSSDTEIAAMKAEMAKINKNLMRVLQPPLAKPRTYMLWEPIKVMNTASSSGSGTVPSNTITNPKENLKGVTTRSGNAYQGPLIPTTSSSLLQVIECETEFMKMNTASSSGLGILPGNTITNPKEDLKGITTRSGTVYQGPTIPTTSSFLPPVVEHETEATKDMVHPTNNGITKDVQPPVVQIEFMILNSEPVVDPIIEPVVALVSAPKPNQRPSTLFADALILIPKFGPIKTLLTNKDKLSELARTPLNEYCLAVLLKKLPEKLRDLGKFLIPCDFPEMAECLALADLGASINLMPFSM